MKRFVRMTVLAAAAAALTACGGGAKLGGGKQGAAQALYQASASTSEGGQTAGQRIRSIAMERARAVASGVQDIDISGEIEVECTKGGSASMKLDIAGGDTSGKLVFDISYDDCSEDGVNSIDGDMKMTFFFDFDFENSDSFEMKLGMQGKIEFSGDVDDFIDADVIQYVGINGTSGQVTVKIDGKIATSTDSYTYANESFNFSATAELPTAEEEPAA